MNRYIATMFCLPLLLVILTGCAPEVGSEKWCKAISEKPKADWSVNEAGDYAKHCLMK
ncbi:DUF3012 domain-containing protein [Pseudomonadota bacterium]